MLKLALWFLKRRFLTFVNVFSLFPNYLPVKKGWAFNLNKLKSPSPKDALRQIWLKFAQWFWRRRFLNFVNVFSLSLFSLLGKGRAPSFEQGWILFTQDWLKFAQCFLRRRQKCEKFTKTTSTMMMISVQNQHHDIIIHVALSKCIY